MKNLGFLVTLQEILGTLQDLIGTLQELQKHASQKNPVVLGAFELNVLDRHPQRQADRKTTLAQSFIIHIITIFLFYACHCN